MALNSNRKYSSIVSICIHVAWFWDVFVQSLMCKLLQVLCLLCYYIRLFSIKMYCFKLWRVEGMGDLFFESIWYENKPRCQWHSFNQTMSECAWFHSAGKQNNKSSIKRRMMRSPSAPLSSAFLTKSFHSNDFRAGCTTHVTPLRVSVSSHFSRNIGIKVKSGHVVWLCSHE